MHKIEQKDLLIVFFISLLAFLASIIYIYDYDFWFHLASGREIFNRGGLPDKEIFCYPSLNLPYWNPEWLFDLALYAVYLIGSFKVVVLFKSFIIAMVFAVLALDSFVPYRRRFLSLAVLFFTMLLMRHRFVERPDIFLFLFISIQVYLLDIAIYQRKKLFLWFPVIQLLWVNMHPSFVLGFYIFGVFIFAGIAGHFLRNKIKLNAVDIVPCEYIKPVFIVLLISIAVSLLNPSLLKPFVAPFEFIASQVYKDEISELQPPAWQNFKLLFVLTPVLAISFLLSFRRFSLFHLLLLLPFAYMGHSAARYVSIYSVLAAPVMVRNFSAFWEQVKEKLKFKIPIPKGISGFLKIALVVTILVVEILIVRGIPPIGKRDRVFGFGINSINFPEGALRYIDSNGIYGNIFNTYHYGGYIIWREFPKRKPFMDGRGYLPEGLLDNALTARVNFETFQNLEKEYRFDIVIVDYPTDEIILSYEDMKGVDLGFTSQDWMLVYWDDAGMVYLRKDGQFKSIVERDAYRYAKPANGVRYFLSLLDDRKYLDGAIKELKRNLEINSDGMKTRVFLGYLYNELGMYEDALETFKNLLSHPESPELLKGYLGSAFAYYNMKDYKNAVKYYKKYLKYHKDPETLYNLGVVYKLQGRLKDAATLFRKALNLSPNLIPAYQKLIEVYTALDKAEEIEKLKSDYLKAKMHSGGESHFKRALSLSMLGNAHEAMKEYKISIEVNPYNPAAHSNLGYLYYDAGFKEMAFAEFKKAVELDSNYPEAHYGLALVYREQDNIEKAIEHWELYVNLAPGGHWSRRAREELKMLKKE
ncbi:MAG TPA: tetratricopeptide repeat protein [bacterium]